MENISVFSVGQRVVFIEEYDIFPHAKVKKGEIGTISHSYEDELFVRLDNKHEGLSEWENEAQFCMDERKPENYIILASALSNDQLEELGLGRCDNCQDVQEIGRGDQFGWDEENSRWLCIPCQDDDTKPEDKRFFGSWGDGYFQPGETDNMPLEQFCDNNGYDLDDIIKVRSLKVGESVEFNQNGEHKIERIK
jgi:hypothetical protein